MWVDILWHYSSRAKIDKPKAHQDIIARTEYTLISSRGTFKKKPIESFNKICEL